jgi:hypothetical protein
LFISQLTANGPEALDPQVRRNKSSLFLLLTEKLSLHPASRKLFQKIVDQGLQVHIAGCAISYSRRAPVRLKEFNLTGIVADGTKFSGFQLSNAQLKKGSFDDARFAHGDISDTEMSKAQLHRLTIVEFSFHINVSGATTDCPTLKDSHGEWVERKTQNGEREIYRWVNTGFIGNNDGEILLNPPFRFPDARKKSGCLIS